MVNLIKQLNNFQFPRYGELLNGLLVRKNLALNRHWYDALLDFSPTTLIIDLNDLNGFDLSKFKQFKIEKYGEPDDVYGMKERFDVHLL